MGEEGGGGGEVGRWTLDLANKLLILTASGGSRESFGGGGWEINFKIFLLSRMH